MHVQSWQRWLFSATAAVRKLRTLMPSFLCGEIQLLLQISQSTKVCECVLGGGGNINKHTYVTTHRGDGGECSTCRRSLQLGTKKNIDRLWFPGGHYHSSFWLSERCGEFFVNKTSITRDR